MNIRSNILFTFIQKMDNTILNRPTYHYFSSIPVAFSAIPRPRLTSFPSRYPPFPLLPSTVFHRLPLSRLLLPSIVSSCLLLPSALLSSLASRLLSLASCLASSPAPFSRLLLSPVFYCLLFCTHVARLMANTSCYQYFCNTYALPFIASYSSIDILVSSLLHK